MQAGWCIAKVTAEHGRRQNEEGDLDKPCQALCQGQQPTLVKGKAILHTLWIPLDEGFDCGDGCILSIQLPAAEQTNHGNTGSCMRSQESCLNSACMAPLRLTSWQHVAAWAFFCRSNERVKVASSYIQCPCRQERGSTRLSPSICNLRCLEDAAKL